MSDPWPSLDGSAPTTKLATPSAPSTKASRGEKSPTQKASGWGKRSQNSNGNAAANSGDFPSLTGDKNAQQPIAMPTEQAPTVGFEAGPSAPLKQDEQAAFSKQTPLAGGGSIREVYGDLMTAKDSLCHCVSACLAMGKGIAVLFKDNFGGVAELKAQKVDVGGVALLSRPTENRFIYYLITKPRYFDKPTYETLAASLNAMLAHMKEHDVKSISMPEIGCGLDGLTWDRVHAMLCEIFSGAGIDITVYHFKPAKQHYSKRPSARGGNSTNNSGRGRGGSRGNGGRGRGGSAPRGGAGSGSKEAPIIV